MDITLLRLFQTHVMKQCEFLLLAADQVNHGLASGNRDNMEIFFGLQNLLNAAANISKAFWGQGGKLADQRKPLRDSIGILDDSPLRAVTMRNNFEHFDERLEKWWRESKRHASADFILVLGEVITSEPIDIFRVYYPKTANLTFWGQEFNVQAIINEAKQILPKLREESKKPRSGAVMPTF